MLQFITNAPDKESTVSQVRQVLDGGCKWIQLRMTDAPRNVIIDTATALKPMCAEAEAILVVDDHVDIAKELALDGVHLGKNDMNVKDAREQLGEKFIIGATANTLEDVLALSPVYIDYISLGPFKLTAATKNLSPVIQVDSYRNIATVNAGTNRNIPLVAIGGIEYSDIDSLMATGIDGIAVSSALINAADITKATRQWVDHLNNILETRLTNKGL